MNNAETEIVLDATWLDGVFPWLFAGFALTLVALMVAGAILLVVIAKAASRPRVPFTYATMEGVTKGFDTIVIHE